MIAINIRVAKPYDVIIGNGSLKLLGTKIQQLLPDAKKIAIITDEHVKALYLHEVQEHLVKTDLEIFDYAIIPGEASKNSDNYIKLQNWLATCDLTAADIIIALGGGVIGDLAGFVAATYLRGIAYIQIPSTLLAMVDSSVGGKTAINLSAGKNLVGAFYQPTLVLCDPRLLDTLTADIMQDGYSEIIKYGMLGNADLLTALTEDHLNMNEIIATCIKMKRDLVLIDEFDQNERKFLNFGHTIGHAIEQNSHYQISHGRAVAIGMAMDTRAAVALGLCDNECLTRLRELLKKYKLPESTTYTPKEIYEAATHDKKRQGNSITNVIPYKLGKCKLETISMSEFYEWIKKGSINTK